jgi:hypothetical protein
VIGIQPWPMEMAGSCSQHAAISLIALSVSCSF